MAISCAKEKQMNRPSVDEWLIEAKSAPNANKCGMYLVHNGIVRETPKAKVRFNEDTGKSVNGMYFSYDEVKVSKAIEDTYKMPGIYYVKVWLNQGNLELNDDIMLVLIGGDIRPHVVDALQSLVGFIKNECVVETEKYA